MSDDTFDCPLECGVRIKKLARHLSKCQNFKLLGVKYRQCEYNKMHIIKNELYELHLLSCNSKKKYEEDQSDSNDDDIAGKFSDDSDHKDEDKNTQNKNSYNKETNDLENNNENEKENENEDNNPNKRKRRYRHERALFKNEEEIDQECLDFFNKVYIISH
jgi:hypothetical protein